MFSPHTSAARRTVCATLLLCFAADSVRALPPGFVDQLYIENFNQATGLTFAPDGRMFVWEKGGRVWNVENGLKAAVPLVNIAEEVGNWRDYGLLGFAIDPDFNTNGYIYLLYVVDYHHLQHFGTPGYSPATNQYLRDTIARLTRYQCNPADGMRSVLPGTRTVLIGESMGAGLPICHQSHGIGSLVFGEDGTLLISIGDGASYESVDTGTPTSGSSNTCLADGIITAKEDVGAYRAQLLDGLNGKVLRVDPATGDGVPSNPYFDPLFPRSARSRVWAMGLRNPFRMGLRPGSGSADPAAGDPGTLLIGDVGWNAWEELNVATGPGVNFGWPVFEGLERRASYADLHVDNEDAPNPLFGLPGCTEPFFAFRDLIVQDSLDPLPSFPNPCDAGQQVPASLPRWKHTRPALEWGHGIGPARVGYYVGTVAAIAHLGTPQSPVIGAQFGGNSATGGTWYTGAGFPAEYHDTYFLADFAAKWLRNIVFDADGRPLEVREFAPTGSAAFVALAADPLEGWLYYINYDDEGRSTLRRILWVLNAPPLAAAAASPPYGPAPLSVQFTGSGSSDPDGDAAELTYAWDFGDGTPISTEVNPQHTFPGPRDVTASGSFTAKVFELSPPNPQGGGNWDPEVMRDGDLPTVGNPDSQRQYDTFHFGQQGDEDYVGYTFAEDQRIYALLFQEGKHFFDGGWWDQFRVQYRTAGGAWADVTGLSVSPAYPGSNGVSYETFTMSFVPVDTRGIRLYGNPGGSANFISVGELRAYAEPNTIHEPTRFDVTLTVRDVLGGEGSANVAVWINNTPPQVVITSPVDGSTYPPGGESFVQNLTAGISDAEHGAAKLTCGWQTSLHHNEHVHPEPIDANCTTTTVVTPVGCDGETYFVEVSLRVTDPLGLATQVSAYLYPDCPFGDFDYDLDVDLHDAAEFVACFSGDGVPHAGGHCDRGDAEPDGDVDLADWAAMAGDFTGALDLHPGGH